MWMQTWGTSPGLRNLAGWIALLVLWVALAVLVDMSVSGNIGSNVEVAATPQLPSAATSALADGDDVRAQFLVRVPDVTPAVP